MVDRASAERFYDRVAQRVQPYDRRGGGVAEWDRRRSQRQSPPPSSHRRIRGGGGGTSAQGGRALRRYHNLVKQHALMACSVLVEPPRTWRLWDVGCGRGGDAAKWAHTPRLEHVWAIDASAVSLQQAQQRLAASLTESAPGGGQSPPLTIHWQQVTTLGSERAIPSTTGDEVSREARYQVATCMFALQYFCGSANQLSCLLHSVTDHLEPGGWFVVCVPSAPRLMAWDARAARGEPGLHATITLPSSKATHPSTPSFGQVVQCAIDETVTEEGSVEYLVWPELVHEVAATVHLQPAVHRLRSVFPLLEEAVAEDGSFVPPPAQVPADWRPVSRLFQLLAWQYLPPPTPPPPAPVVVTASPSGKEEVL